MAVFNLSFITKDEKTALYCYANGWDKEGKPYFNCLKCSDSQKVNFGCGYDKNKGKSKLKSQDEHDLYGSCPAYWRQQPYIIDVLQMRAFKENLGHPLHIPNRLLMSMTYLNIYEDAARERLREMEQKK
jgi:hypothetical protein